MHDLRIDELLAGKQSLRTLRSTRAAVRRARPAGSCSRTTCSTPAWRRGTRRASLAGNLLANVTRNLWTFAVIFCGHFPDGVEVFSEEETRDESRGQWYVRQVRGSANIEGGRWLHLLTGHLSHQIEHHLFPDLPAARYPEIAPRVREICARYGQAYPTGSFRRQLGSVARRLLGLALPTRPAAPAPRQVQTAAQVPLAA